MVSDPIAERDINENSRFAAISYVPPLSLICLLFRRDSHFIRFHAKQGLVLMILAILVWLIPHWLKILPEIVIALGMGVGFVKAASSQFYHIPVVTEILAGKVNWKIRATRKKEAQSAAHPVSKEEQIKKVREAMEREQAKTLSR